MISEMRGHRHLIGGHQDAPIQLGPEQQVRVEGAQREIWRIAYAPGVDQELSSAIVIVNRPPERPAQVLIEDKSDGHGIVLRSFGLMAFFQAASQFGKVQAFGLSGKKPIQFNIMSLNHSVYFDPVVEVKRDHLVDHRQRECRELVPEHFRGITFIVVPDDVMKPYAVAGDANKTIWLIGEEIGQ
jgi:hypothetical protein